MIFCPNHLGYACPANDEYWLAHSLMQALRGARFARNLWHWQSPARWCTRLAWELAFRRYEPRPYTCFIVRDPRPREVFAPHPADRLVQRWFVRQVLPFIEKRLMPHSYACLPGRGPHRAVQRLRHWLRNTRLTAYLKADIHNFFYSVDRRRLTTIVHRWLYQLPVCYGMRHLFQHLAKAWIWTDPTENPKFTCPARLWRLLPAHKSLFNIPKNRGMPLGNHTSQLFANLYLHELDRFIVHHLRQRYYIRYMDDFLILGTSTRALHRLVPAICKFLQEHLGLTLHPRKVHIHPTRYGVPLCGYLVWKHRTLVRHATLQRMRKRLHTLSMLATNWNSLHASRTFYRNTSTDKFLRQHQKIFLAYPHLITQFVQASWAGIRGWLIHADSQTLRHLLIQSLNEQSEN